MKIKETKYYDSGGSLVREKLMVRRIVEGKETIEEADFHCLAGNIEELYFLAMRGKRISSGLMKIWKTNRIDDIIAYIRSAKDCEECIQKICAEFDTSKEIAESIVDMTLSQITGIELNNLIESQHYYEKAVECLKPLMDMQRQSDFSDE